MTYTDWNIKHRPADFPCAGTLPQLLWAMLCVRGITDAGEINDFLYGGTEQLSDPLLLPDMTMAVARLARAVRDGEKCAVYGDYDVDGITAACLMTDYLRSLGLDCEAYIPDRLEEGYGLNSAAIEMLKNRGVSLLVTVDCGVTAVAEAEFASSIGVDMIITDHHECMEELPAACAVVDPKLPGCSSPARGLAGVGVAFKLACAMDGDADKILERYCDLVAVGTIADVMPLTGENRCIIKAGLKKLAQSPRPGLSALMTEAGISDKKLQATSVSFTLAPRLNAAGRLGKAAMAAELLMSANLRRCRELAEDLCELNRERQRLEQNIREEALAMLNGTRPDAPIVLASEGWHQGVIGIAASRLAEQYSLPAIMICLDGDKGKGSCRSFGGFNLFEAMTACSEHLDSFGGHALAVGLNISRENVDSFRAALAEYYKTCPPAPESLLEIDLLIDEPDLLDIENVSALDLMEPCGSGNPKPVMCMLDAVVESVIPIGNGKHMKLRVCKKGKSFECVFFSHSTSELRLRTGERVDLAFTPRINEFRSKSTVQLLLCDLRRSRTDELCENLLRHGESRCCRQTSDYLPDRNDFAAIWRNLAAAGGRLSGDMHRILDPFIYRGMPGPTACQCLKVFDELGLISLGCDGDNFDIVRVETDKKADLESSELLGRFRKN